MIGPPSGDMDKATGSNAFAEGLAERGRGGPRSSSHLSRGFRRMERLAGRLGWRTIRPRLGAASCT